jgi:hypothetical protein
MNRIFSRRQFLAQLAAAPLSSAIGATLPARAHECDDCLAAVCVLAWTGRKPRARTVDLWMARCGSIDATRLSDVLRRFVVWDDITSERTTARSVEAIKTAITHYFDITIHEDGSNAIAHVGEIDAFPEALSRALALCTSQGTLPAERIAIVDLSSCGVTRLQWRDIIPSLRRHYATVVGIDYTDPDLISLDAAVYSAPQGISHESWRTLAACDYWAVASPTVLAHEPDLCFDARAALFTDAINELARHIALAPDVATGFFRSRQHFVGYGSRRQTLAP